MLELILFGAGLVFVYMCLWYLASIFSKDASLVDIAWGLGFVVLAIGLAVAHECESPIHYLVTGLVTVWGLRLSYHIAKRKIGKPEDWRYQKWRKDWGKWFAVRSFFQIFILQGLLLLIISASVFVASYSSHEASLGVLQYIGLTIWLVGFYFEVVGDWQLRKFLKTKKPGQIMQTGLWRYSRHPNYFGEVVMWWGLWIMVIDLKYGLLAVVSPILITYLILYVSGVPLLEKKYANDKEFKKYAEKTSKFVPMPVIKVKRSKY